MFKAFKVKEYPESFEEHIKALEQQLDLKEFYDIKRPTAVIFSQQQVSKESKNKSDQKQI